MVQIGYEAERLRKVNMKHITGESPKVWERGVIMNKNN
jgi:hypothetical protein